MARKKTDLAIINRDFWPQGQVIGEALLQLAENASKHCSVCVITQADESLPDLMARAERGHGIDVRACKAYTDSASGLLKRIFEAVFFMVWVFVSLVRAKPASVYVSTNPPVVVPFIVAVYCRLFRASYVYHLQDIHPEITNIVVPLNGLALSVLKGIDNYTMKNARSIITLSRDMEGYVRGRSGTASPIYLLDNPSLEVEPAPFLEREKDFVFCGNAGRLQRIPLLISAIEEYLNKGGRLRFTFAGGGLYAPEIKSLSNTYPQVEYLGVIPAKEAAELVNKHKWALLPIDDEVTKFAFPSKSSGYALSGAAIIAICGKKTSIGEWVTGNNLGKVCEPDRDAVVHCFFEIEARNADGVSMDEEMRKKLMVGYFSNKLYEYLTPESSRV